MSERITLGQYYEASSFLHRLDARAKIAATLLYMIALFLAPDWRFLLVCAFPFLICLQISRIPMRVFWRSMRLIVLFVVITMLANIFFTEGDLLWRWAFIRITWQGIIKGLIMSLRLFLLIAFASLLTLTTKPLTLTYGLESLLKPLARLGLPAQELAMMMSLALRFIPTIMEELQRIMEAQRVRGADFSRGGPGKRVRALIPLLVPLFVCSLQRSADLAQAMESKCYQTGQTRTNWKPLLFTAKDAVYLLLFLLILLAMLFLRLANNAYIQHGA
ncbi:MAG: energy-coupling factor transporter transmembrane protein EcfT [Clostridiales bacterium]|nr:energy-coupling factor transporter transmembrane protein EcfT [Clostridiales bacterium]